MGATSYSGSISDLSSQLAQTVFALRAVLGRFPSTMLSRSDMGVNGVRVENDCFAVTNDLTAR
jgi:hypothetical protein